MVSKSKTPWTIARKDPLSMGVSRQEYWRGLPFPSPGDRVRSSQLPGSSSCGTAGNHVLSMTSSNTHILKTLSKTINSNQFCLLFWNPSQSASCSEMIHKIKGNTKIYCLQVIVKWSTYVSFPLLAWICLEGQEHTITIFFFNLQHTSIWDKIYTK